MTYPAGVSATRSYCPVLDPAALGSVLSAAVAQGDVPGVVAAVATADGQRYLAAFGTGDAESGAALRPDALFFIASMTKAVTAVAAMQLVEQRLLGLDEPIADVLPELKAMRVLEGFSESGDPILRPARRAITLRHLLAHTAGFAYAIWNEKSGAYAERNSVPTTMSYQLASMDLPLISDPGEEWHYGMNIDFVGRAVERVSGLPLDQYFSKKIFSPLGMHDSCYVVPEQERHRRVRLHSRRPEGGFAATDFAIPEEPEFFPGGMGLFCTAGDYLTFVRMLLEGGTLDGQTIVSARSVEEFGRNQLNGATMGPMKSFQPAWSEDVDFFPGMERQWGLGFLINPRQAVTGRAAGSLSWAGGANSFFWVDRARGVAGVFMAQLFPFCDARVLRSFYEFERSVYDVRQRTFSSSH